MSKVVFKTRSRRGNEADSSELSNDRLLTSAATKTITGRYTGVITGALTAAAAALLIISLKLPLWHMHLEAPQYRDEEALNVVVYPNAFRGDLEELAVLNQYIGVHVPETLPQFQWLPSAFIATGVLGIAAAFLSRKFRSRALVLVPAALSVALLVASIQAMQQMRDIGHKRDQKTVMAGVKNFTPPFLGSKKIAQFDVTSGLSLGSWLIGSALALQVTAAWLSRNVVAADVRRRTSDQPICTTPPRYLGGYPANSRP